MDVILTNNPCLRCGKNRIVVSSHEEYIGNSKIKITKTACPDPDCQVIVDRQLEKEKAKRTEVAVAFEKRKEAGKLEKAALKLQI